MQYNLTGSVVGYVYTFVPKRVFETGVLKSNEETLVYVACSIYTKQFPYVYRTVTCKVVEFI
jgi:hypothetical protein